MTDLRGVIAACWGVAVIGTSAGAQDPPQLSETATAPRLETRASEWPVGLGPRGGGGLYRIDTAYPLPAGSLVLSVGGRYFKSADFIEPGDDNERQVQEVVALWAVGWGFELSLGTRTTTNTNSGPPESPYDPASSQTLGDPSVGLKYSTFIHPKLGLGSTARLLFPTSAQGRGISADAFILDAKLVASWRTTSWLLASVNAGVRWDQSRRLFGSKLPAVQQFAGWIGRSNLITAGIGLGSHFEIGNILGLGPFVETTAGFGEVAIERQPVLATFGAKFYPAGPARVLDLTLGADIRLSGAPGRNGARLPGLPPWEVFGRVSVNLFPDVEQRRVANNNGSCIDDSGCGEDRQCVEGVCSALREVVRLEEVLKPLPTFSIEGNVFNALTEEPVRGATIAVTGVASSPLAVDPNTGAFTSFPLPVGEGLVQVKVEAPGFQPVTETLSRGGADEVKQLTLKLQPSGEAAKGLLRGSLKNARNGRSLKGQVFIPVLGRRIRTDPQGQFEASLKVGRYQMLVSGRGFVTQRKEIEIRAGDVVILNVDMRPRRRR